MNFPDVHLFNISFAGLPHGWPRGEDFRWRWSGKFDVLLGHRGMTCKVLSSISASYFPYIFWCFGSFFCSSSSILFSVNSTLHCRIICLKLWQAGSFILKTGLLQLFHGMAKEFLRWLMSAIYFHGHTKREAFPLACGIRNSMKWGELGHLRLIWPAQLDLWEYGHML